MLSGWLYLVLEWILPFAMVPVVVRQHRRPFIAIAWLGCIFAFPPVTVPAYFFFSVFGSRRRREAATAVRRRYGAILADRPEAGPAPSLSSQAAAISRVAEASHQGTSVQPLFAGNDVTLLQDDDVIETLCDDIRSASSHVHLLFFMYAPDHTGRAVADALIEAARNGCTCRVLVDAFGSRSMLDELAPELRRHGVTVCALLPMRSISRVLRRHDVRNHRKIAVIDCAIGYSGSSNIHGRRYALDSGEGLWHQIGARITGPAVAALQTLFVEDWALTTGEDLPLADLFPDTAAVGDTAVQVIADGPTYPEDAIQQLYMQAVSCAEKSILLISPYFVPDEPLIVALRGAALRGLDVSLIVPARSDRGLADLAGRATWETLLEAGVRILAHRDGVLHVKAAIVDGSAVLLGTANLDRRSFFLNYELMLFIPDQTIACELMSMADTYEDSCDAIDLERWRERPSRERWKQDFAKLVSPLL